MPKTARLAGVAIAVAACHGNGDEARPLPVRSVSSTGAAVSAEPSLPRSEPPSPGTYRFVGRAVDEPGGGIRFAWSGSRIETRFVGTSLDVELEDDGTNAFEIVLDGTVMPHLRTSRGDRTYRVVEGAAPGEHALVLSKRTEAMAGEVVFHGFHAGPFGRLLKPGDGPRRRLEIIGDSITAGMGNEGTDPCPPSADNQNSFATYGEIAARALAADVINIAWSGVRTSGPSPTMADLYPLALPRRRDSAWKFPADAPDAVVVNLGDNDDFSSARARDAFGVDYIRFVRGIRGRYPNSLIACTTGPMSVGSSEAARQTISAAIGSIGDARIFYLEFAPIDPRSEQVGCFEHPTVKTHSRMAETLVAAVRGRLHW